MSTTPLTPSAPPHYGPYVRSGSSGDVGGTSSRSNSGGEDQLSSNSGHSLEGSMTATKPPLTTTGPNHYYGSDAGTHASSSTASEGTVAAGESSRGTHGGRGGSITSTTGTTVSGGLNSPPLSPSRPHLTKWDENHVKAWLASVNCAQYGTSFEENGITGEVLPMLDDEALRDIGITSVGQRLHLLNGIYKLKETYGLPIQDGDYIPNSEEVVASANAAFGVPTSSNLYGGSSAGGSGYLSINAPVISAGAIPSPWQVAGILREKDERIRTLEHEVNRLGEYLYRFQQDFVGICRVLNIKNSLVADLPPLQPFVPLRKLNSASEIGPNDSAPQHTASSGSTIDQNAADLSFNLPSPSANGLQYANVSVGGHARAGDVDSPTNRTPVSARLGGAITHGAGGAGQPPNLASAAGGNNGSFANAQASMLPGSAANDSVTARGASMNPAQDMFANDHQSDRRGANGLGRGGDGSLVSPTTTSFAGQGADNSTTPALTPTSATSQLFQAAAAAEQAANSGNRAGSMDSGADSNALSGPSSKEKTSSSADNPYKSFRVTLDDPCHKVLPAALKKYKINDDWKQYALFICYGNTERCLSYDEKPLLLFQKLKESKQNPVFMLRNIKDVKSPIAIANAKAEAQGIKSGASRVAKKREQLLHSGDSDSNATGSGSLSISGDRADPRKLSPLNVSNNSAAITPALFSGGVMQRQQSMPRYIGPAAALPNNGIADAATRTYAVAIYPYASERDDEFDVAVGDTFVVLSKAKGWWIVQGDSKADGSGDVALAGSKLSKGEEGESDITRAETEVNGGGVVMESGWVPAGCLLEISRPLLLSGPSSASPSTPHYPSRAGRQRSDSATDALGPGSANNGRNLLPPTAGSGPSEASQMANLADVARLPISPSIIISTSTPGIMLMDFSSPDGLTLSRDDKLRVFKRYNHWSYCVKEGDDHSRGWVPSWFIGKATSSKTASSRGVASSSINKAKEIKPSGEQGTTQSSEIS